MTSWLIPANTEFYDVFAAFECAETYWPMNAKVAPGDTIYIYLASPHKQIGFVCDVLGAGYRWADIRGAVLGFVKGNPDTEPTEKPFMKLAARTHVPIDAGGALSLAKLRENGLSGFLMGARNLDNNPPLRTYIERAMA